MKLTDVTREDGVSLATILTVLNKAKFDGLSGSDIDQYAASKKWLHQLALDMAEQLKKLAQPISTSVPEATTFRVKQMGTLSGAKPKKKKR